MEILAAPIKRQLLLDTGTLGHCAIYKNELQRTWPLNEENRKRKIEQFTKKYGLRLSFYKSRLSAIFEKERPRPSSGAVGEGVSTLPSWPDHCATTQRTSKQPSLGLKRLTGSSESKSKLSLLRSKK